MVIAGSSLRIIVSIGENIGETGSAILTVSNSQGIGTYAAYIQDASKGTVYQDFTPGQLSTTGIWNVWAKYTLQDGRIFTTPARQFTVYPEGTVLR